MNEVFGILSQQGVFTDNVAYAEVCDGLPVCALPLIARSQVHWFFRHLEFDPAYFRHFDAEAVGTTAAGTRRWSQLRLLVQRNICTC